MKKSIYYSFVLCTLSLCTLLTACTKKPAQQNEQQEQPQENEQMVNDQTVNYQDITALTPDGAELSLSDLIGQTDYVLLDFWASW